MLAAFKFLCAIPGPKVAPGNVECRQHSPAWN